MSLDAISSVGPTAASPALLAAARASGFRSGAGASPAAPAEVKKAAKQFEAILVRQLLAPAVEPMMNGSLGGGGGPGGGVYGYMLTDALATSISDGGGLGLAGMLESQLSPRAAPAPAPATP